MNTINVAARRRGRDWVLAAIKRIEAIKFKSGRCRLIDDPLSTYSESQRLADALDGHYMDQFTYAERATDWRSNNNIADSIFQQMLRGILACRGGGLLRRSPVDEIVEPSLARRRKRTGARPR